MAKSNSELLVRIDERQREMASDILSIKKRLETVVTDEKCKERQTNFNKEFIDVKAKTHILWDDRNKMIGWLLGAGIVGGTASTLLSGLAKSVFAMF